MIDMSERKVIGYAIQDSNWPCGEVVNMNVDHPEKGIRLNYVVKKNEYPENFKRCNDKEVVKKFFKEHWREIDNCWDEGYFYVAEVYERI